MAPGDLVTLPIVRQWVGVQDSKSNNDDLLRLLIRGASAVVNNYINRGPIAWRAITDYLDGNGREFALLPSFPVTDIVSIDLGYGTVLTTVSTGSPPSNGYLLIPGDGGSPQRIVLRGYCFPRGRSNIAVSYHAGYRVQAEPWTIAASTVGYVVTTLLSWLADLGVSYAGGAALVAVTGTPTAGQYAVSDGVYTFAAADAGRAVLISYSNCPEDIAQAVKELVGERYRARERIGEISHAMGGQANTTTSFSQKDMSDFIKSSLNPFKAVVPV